MVLHDRDRRDRVAPLQEVGGMVREPDRTHLAVGDEFRHRTDRLLDRHA